MSALKPLRAAQPSSQLPLLLFLQPVPPTPAAPGSPQGEVCVGGSRVPFLPQSSSWAPWSPQSPGCDPSPCPTLPRVSQGIWGWGPSLGEHRGASGGKLPVEDGHVSSSCPARFQPQAQQTATITPDIPPDMQTTALPLYLERIYRQNRTLQKRSASGINSQH